MSKVFVSRSALLQIADTLLKLAGDEPNTSIVDLFLADHCEESHGSMILFSEFFDRFIHSLPSAEQREWDYQTGKLKLIAALPDKFPYGRHNKNQRYIGNIAWRTDSTPTQTIVEQNGRLCFATLRNPQPANHRRPVNPAPSRGRNHQTGARNRR